MNCHKTIISICDYTGIWSKPYSRAGYNVVQLDIKLGQDIRLLKYPGKVHGVIAQPPCTHLASSGARWWESKGESALLEAMSVVDACMRLILVTSPEWWVLENPVGRLKDYLGPYTFSFDPADFAGLADNPIDEAYTKKTCLWGNFTPPLPLFVGMICGREPILGSKMHRLSPSPDRAMLRSTTPSGFAKAFFLANS